MYGDIALNSMITYAIIAGFTEGVTKTSVREIYRIDAGVFQKNVDRFVEMLHMQDFYRTPVRQLSLGQRMKAEVALSLLHEPPILYLDEPTIGLDVLAKGRIIFDGSIERFKKEHAGEGISDIEDMVRSIYEEEPLTV
ncbi:MAG: ATP-binding cassette domain-containing protein [Lachnospiraceae bacterium]|nr:ATP-binding cassette domain-containing protein [Lachnospiraceae bacterium]